MAVSIEHQNDVAIVTIDNPPVNAVSQEVRQGLMDAVKSADENSAVNAVVLLCAGRTFVAGADIKEFGKPPVEPHLPDVMHAIENAQKPWVAAIHGTALGGGLELTMACRARVALKDARMGMPEVNLGLIPGSGGTVRLPRLVAPELALTMIAGGKPITASKAKAAGLIDELVEDDLRSAAITYASKISTATTSATLQRDAIKPIDIDAFEKQKAKLLAKARGQMSIAAAVGSVDNALSQDAETALTNERATFIELKASDQSNALRHIFFAERATLSDPRCKGSAKPFDLIGVIGGGTMGAGISTACLLAGCEVAMIETSDDAATAGQERVITALQSSFDRRLISEQQFTQMQSNFSVSTNYQSLSAAQLVIEAVFEDMSVKKTVFEQLDQATPANAVLASNTSYLDINQIAECVRDPSRVIGLHFFSPAHIMKLLEIVLPDKVSDENIATAAAFAKRLKKTAVLSGVCDGFIGNRIMSSYRREADYLIEDGALPEQVDRAMRDFGFPIGVFEMQDMAGLDIAWAMRKRQAATRDPATRYVTIADQLCEAGRFGRKTGKGWYVYESGKPIVDPEVTAIIEAERQRQQIQPQNLTDTQVIDRIMHAMQSEAQKVLDEGIAAKASDIDVVMTSGYSFPRWRGGPMFMLQT